MIWRKKVNDALSVRKREWSGDHPPETWRILSRSPATVARVLCGEAVASQGVLYWGCVMSFLTSGSGQWALPGQPPILFYNETQESPNTSVGQYENGENGDSGNFRLTYLGGIHFWFDGFSARGNAWGCDIFWTVNDPLKYDIPRCEPHFLLL